MKSAEQSNPAQCYCIRLRRAANRITNHYGDVLNATGVTPNQFSLLATLDRMQGCNTAQLAEAVGLEKSTLVRTLYPIIKAGYIKDQAPEHTRRRALYLTPLGQETLAKGMLLWKEAQKSIRAKLGKNHDEIMAMIAELDNL